MCNCLKATQDMLKEHNTEIVTTIFGTSKPMLWTQQIESGRGKKKAIAVIASFCPFCGTKYDFSTSNGVSVQ